MGEELKPDDVQLVERYDLWYVPHLPMDVPLRRPRDRKLKWRTRLLESIREEGLRHPILVYGHSPKGAFNMHRWGASNEGRAKWLYVAIGTNRYWCLDQLGHETMPAILSMNKGKKPPWEGELITPQDFRSYAPPDCRVWVREHGFGWQLGLLPEDEFAPKI